MILEKRHEGAETEKETEGKAKMKCRVEDIGAVGYEALVLKDFGELQRALTESSS